MSEYQSLYEQAKKELNELQEEFDEFKETSKLIESELENEVESLTKKCNELERENTKIKEDFIEYKVEKNLLKLKNTKKTKKKMEKESKLFENKYESEKSAKEEIILSREALEKKKIELENDNERMSSQIRESNMIISDLENKMNETLEQLALVQTQLEMNQNQSQIQIERLKQQLKETEDELRIYQLSPTRTPDKSNSVISSPLRPTSPKGKSYTIPNKESLPFFNVPISKPSSFMTFENSIKKLNHVDLKERYKHLKKNPEFRLTCDEVALNNKKPPNDEEDKEKNNKTHQKNRSKHHLEEKLKTFSTNLNNLKTNNDGFHKSLDLVNGLIKGLDLKIQKIREMKEVSPRMLSSLKMDGDVEIVNESS